MKLYLAGPMSGYPDFNYPEFHEAARRLRKFHEVINPAENFDGDQSLDWSVYLRKAVQQVAECDGIVLLDGWQKSKGANLEAKIAADLGMATYWYIPHGDDDFKLDPPEDLVFRVESIAQEAHRLVHGGRQQDYGHPYDDFSRSGRMWGAILHQWRMSTEDDVPPALVALCMVAVKISRELNHPKRDNLVDIAGYAQTLELVREREKEIAA